MKRFLSKGSADCRDFQTQLEDAVSAAPSAKDLPDFLATAPMAMKGHAAGCAECRAAAEGFLEARAFLSALPSRADMGGPWFAPRVMAAIAARRGELSHVPATWTFLPKLAARFTWASAIALLLASGWLYQRPATNTSAAKSVVTDITGEPVVDNAAPANNDEVLVSLAEKPR